jgi:hypothetical protein
MLPTVTRLSSIDTYRDGGSLGITFDGEEKYWYELLFPINLDYKRDESDRIVDRSISLEVCRQMMCYLRIPGLFMPPTTRTIFQLEDRSGK